LKSEKKQSSADPKAVKNKIENKSPKKKVEEKIREPSESSPPESQPKLETETEEKASAKKGPKGPHVLKEVAWPVKRFINPYGFIHLSSDILASLHIPKGTKTDATLDLNEEGDLIVKIGAVEKKEGEKKNVEQS